MLIELTREQQKQIAAAGAAPIRVNDPGTREEYVLVSRAEYEQLLAVVENDIEQRNLRRAAARSVAKRLADDE